jgi:hypothetical protein
MNMTSTQGLTEAARSGVDAMIGTLGATTVQLQMPLPPATGSDGGELGLQVPALQQKPLAPVAIRRSSGAVRVLVSADTLETALGVEGTGAIETAIKAVASVVIDDEAFLPTGVEALDVCGGVCLYRLVLQPKGTEV